MRVVVVVVIVSVVVGALSSGTFAVVENDAVVDQFNRKLECSDDIILSLVNADDDTIIGPLMDTIDLCANPSSLSIIVDPESCRDKASFKLFDVESDVRLLKNVEREAPLSLGGDIEEAGDYLPVPFLREVGSYRIWVKARPRTKLAFIKEFYFNLTMTESCPPSPSPTELMASCTASTLFGSGTCADGSGEEFDSCLFESISGIGCREFLPFSFRNSIGSTWTVGSPFTCWVYFNDGDIDPGTFDEHVCNNLGGTPINNASGMEPIATVVGNTEYACNKCS